MQRDETKVNSPDNIPITFFMRTVHNIKKPLYIIFKLALKNMKYPSQWKSSLITPIFKAGDNTNIENYRPISILSAASKMLDKLVFKHLLNRVAHLLVTEQHGFTAGKSTITNLLEFFTH